MDILYKLFLISFAIAFTSILVGCQGSESQTKVAKVTPTPNSVVEKAPTKAPNDTLGASGYNLLSSMNEKLGHLQRKFAEESESLSDVASEEWSNQLRIEYKVFKINIQNNLNNIETKLNKLGLERWDCFHVESDPEIDGSMIVFCKRLPLTAVRMIPRIGGVF